MPRFVSRERKHKTRSRNQNHAVDTNVLELSLDRNTDHEEDDQVETVQYGKLKKVKTQELIVKLAKTKANTSTLRSSKKLGEGSKPHFVRTSILPEVELATPAQPVFGVGLKRPLDIDEVGRPIIEKRQKPTSESQQQRKRSTFEGLSSCSESQKEEQPPNRVESLERSSAFKTWANHFRHETLENVPSTFTSETNTTPVKSRSTNFDNGISTAVQKPDPTNRTAFNIHVVRDQDISESRLLLPVVAEEQRIMESIHNNNCSIICGATGSGKTTQIPQFLFEAGYGSPDGHNPGMIGVTQPRRVAAVSMANRVKTELGPDFEHVVSHQIRFESSVREETAIKFMTDGILLREIMQDFLLTKYSAVIVDEAHERTVNTDVIIGMLTRIVEARLNMSEKNSKCKPLKLIIMSATMRITDFVQNPLLFRHGIPPVVEVEGRQFDVTIHFAKNTQCDYIDEMFKKVSLGHRRLPQGGILVFLTGRSEIDELDKRLRGLFQATEPRKIPPRMRVSAVEQSLDLEDVGNSPPGTQSQNSSSDNEINIWGTDDTEDEDNFFNTNEDSGDLRQIHILPLYSQLPSDQQLRVFSTVPKDSRLIVLATNIAETSITIPGIKYVFDCGRAKEKKYDRLTGVQSFEIGWISKASANQRAGRAGRTSSGHCYRLFSSAVYDRDFVSFADPEILRVPAEGIVLTLKSMGISNVEAFPFPTLPDQDRLVKAENLLEILGAINAGKVTDIGKELAMYPLPPRLSRILHVGQRQNLLTHTIALVAALSVPDIFVLEGFSDLRNQDHEEDRNEGTDHIETQAQESHRRIYNEFHTQMASLDRSCDALKFLKLFCIEFNSRQDREGLIESFIQRKAFNEVFCLRLQLTNIVRSINPLIERFCPILREPMKAEIGMLRQIIATGYIDHVAIRADQLSDFSKPSIRTRLAVKVPYVTLFRSGNPEKIRYTRHAGGTGAVKGVEYVYIHSTSLLAKLPPEKLPKFVIYSHLSNTIHPRTMNRNHRDSSNSFRTRMHPLTPITTRELIGLTTGTPLLENSKPIGKIEPLSRENGVERRACWILHSLKGEPGMTPWPLPPARKVVQRKNLKDGWLVERLLMH